MTRPPIRVLYIAGGLRTGSTIVDRFLGTRPGVRSLGEVGQTWHLGALENRRCTCGQPFAHCSFWGRLAADRPDALDLPVALEIDAYNLQIFPTRRLHRVMSGRGVRRTIAGAPSSYLPALADLYDGIAECTAADLLVDSSKHPVYLAMVASAAELDVRMIHLVRDPRAVAFSWRREVIEPGASDELHMQQLPPARSALYWSLWNIATERVQRALRIPTIRLRYEDFTEEPERELDDALRTLWPDGFPDGAAPLGPSHLLSGNPSRFDEGPVQVNADTEWRAVMNHTDERTVTALTLPLLRRYGYPIRPRREPPR